MNCEICGAKVRNQSYTTCDGLCLRAKKNGLSRTGQIRRDMAEEAREEKRTGRYAAETIYKLTTGFCG